MPIKETEGLGSIIIEPRGREWIIKCADCGKVLLGSNDPNLYLHLTFITRDGKIKLLWGGTSYASKTN